VTNVLIPTQAGDRHATSVAHALRAQGNRAVLWYGSDYPTRQTASISLGDRSVCQWEVSGTGVDIGRTPFDVVWQRRRSRAVLPNEIHSADRAAAERECNAFTDALWELIEPGALWVNPNVGRARARHKPLQLLEAVRAGLSTPPTLCSNDPERIREFMASHKRGVIYKAFLPAHWITHDGGACAFTAVLTPDDLPSDDILRLTPGIFQPRIEKDYELRSTYVGDYCATAKLLSQKNEASMVDWRASFGDLAVERSSLPAEVDSACRRLMRRLEIVFGCFDFIVTPRGEHVFLEINEMGQFLWLDEANDEFDLFGAFCHFLGDGYCGSDWQPGPTTLKFRDFKHASAVEEEALHVPSANCFSVDETDPVFSPSGGTD